MDVSWLVPIALCLCLVICDAGESPPVEGPPLTRYYTGECILCPAGSAGPAGPIGAPGVAGRDGRDGRDRGCCDGGNSDGGDGGGDGGGGGGGGGDSGGGPPSRGGAVYVRWGMTECSSDSQLVYSGIAAGGHYTHPGSGSNYLCLPEDPIYDEPQAGTGGNRAILYAAEYEMNTFPNWASLHDHNVPCAVCWASSRNSLLVVPARNVCPGSDWTTEYAGYMVASFYNHPGRSQFVCMDRQAEVVSRSSHNTDGALFYVADARCGSSGSGLPCPPYEDGGEITCAVCTR